MLGRHSIQHNDTQHDDTQHSGLIYNTQHKRHSASMTLSITVSSAIMLDVIMLIVAYFMLSVFLLNVVMPESRGPPSFA
jgi:hypothetical protein